MTPRGGPTSIRSMLRTSLAALLVLLCAPLLRGGVRAQDGGDLDAALANLYAGVVGAVYLDAGLEAARTFVHDTLRSELAEARARGGEALPKQASQEVCQRDFDGPPTYEVLETRGDANSRAFKVAARAGGERFPSAWGRTVKEAEHWAAFEALLSLGYEAKP